MRVWCVQIRVSQAPPPLLVQEKHDVSGGSRRQTVMLHSVTGLIHFQALLLGLMASFIKGSWAEFYVCQRCKLVCSFYSLVQIFGNIKEGESQLLFIAQELQKLFYACNVLCLQELEVNIY